MSEIAKGSLRKSERLRVTGLPTVELSCSGANEREIKDGSWVVVKRNTGESICLAAAEFDAGHNGGAHQDGEVRADQTVRLALHVSDEGLESEEVSLHRPTRFEAGSWRSAPAYRNALFHRNARTRGWPTLSIVAAVQLGELTLAEQNAVVVEELTLDALGVKSGDEVQLFAARWDKNCYCVVRKSVKAYAMTDHVRDKRSYTKDEQGQLPRILMGDAIRKQLGVGLYKTCSTPHCSTTVVIKPQVRFQIIDHSWELILLILGAALGVSVGWDGTGVAQKIGVVTGLLLTALGLLYWRVYRRLR